MALVRSSKQFRAIQYNGRNVDEIREFIGIHRKATVITKTTVRVRSLYVLNYYYDIDLGCWITKSETGKLKVYSNRKYTEQLRGVNTQ